MRRTRANDRFLKHPRITHADQVQRVEVEHRVDHDLPGAVIGDIAPRSVEATPTPFDASTAVETSRFAPAPARFEIVITAGCSTSKTSPKGRGIPRRPSAGLVFPTPLSITPARRLAPGRLACRQNSATGPDLLFVKASSPPSGPIV